MSAGSTSPFPPIPHWAWLVAAALLLSSLGVLIWGRGGTAVLIGAVLAFLALAVLLLSVPDGDPEVA